MSARSRLATSLTAGLLAGAAVARFAATRRHASLAAAAARSTAHGQPESVTGILATGFTATAVVVAVVVFAIATMVTLRRRHQLVRQYRGYTATRPTYTGYGSHRGRW